MKQSKAMNITEEEVDEVSSTCFSKKILGWKKNSQALLN